MLTIVIQVLLGIVLLLIATIAFDALHYLLHRFTQSRFSLLRRLGALHAIHHEFLDRDLQIHEGKIRANIYCHVVPEFLVQVLMTLLLALIFPWLSVLVALTIEVFVFAFIMQGKPGFDVNHKEVDQLLAYKPMYFCLPEYHLLHHVYPDAHFSSWIKTWDHLLATGCSLCDRNILLLGSETEFTNAFFEGLEKQACKVVRGEGTDSQLKQADILLVCEENYSKLFKQFYTLHKNDEKPVEIWALALNKNPEFFTQARLLFRDEKIIYRHLVIKNKDPNKRDEKNLLKGVRRGFNYVPGYYSWRMFLDYFYFIRLAETSPLR